MKNMYAIYKVDNAGVFMPGKKEKNDEKTNTSKVNVSSSPLSSTLQGKPVNCRSTEDFKNDIEEIIRQNK
ncbi:hypothetical protein [Acetobacter thailandicus]|uniref:hypothetical protein n=1 Tax=Acetobacter thailandicus TaxID=1502842 RepID=UPI001BAD11AC|nr:hypothetical protein [Acetobacter thailandicus]MBS0986838.1 hypothetical protein [Acetobacter thailandicus]